MPYVEEFVCELEDLMMAGATDHGPRHNNMCVYDLVCAFYPGPRRFEKFLRGAGVGQLIPRHLQEEKARI